MSLKRALLLMGLAALVCGGIVTPRAKAVPEASAPEVFAVLRKPSAWRSGLPAGLTFGLVQTGVVSKHPPRYGVVIVVNHGRVDGGSIGLVVTDSPVVATEGLAAIVHGNAAKPIPGRLNVFRFTSTDTTYCSGRSPCYVSGRSTRQGNLVVSAVMGTSTRNHRIAEMAADRLLNFALARLHTLNP
jgi:hypothetical protein